MEMYPAISLLPLGLAMLVAGCADDRHEDRLKQAGPNPTIEKLMTVSDADAGARKFRTCAACHQASKGAPDLGGPNLYGVYGQAMGRNSPRFAYTAALIGAKGRWDDRTLDAWITNPQQLVPGTSMQFPGIADPLDRADVIAYLRHQRD